ncbi:hypothetical protein N7495_006514 [Penicillium taxi]|uniref:uncharacterized protein n=1 Tax=Penicillium taxi TaxID=168475 RepID=UPI0025458FEA|nr:uncharacterized protein N7495_006514 [Penicillium taxi]KAJ5894823.1 hypothetical protein N7495_006514 [Penicillium taxi]
MANDQPDLSDVAVEAAKDFFNQVFGVLIAAVQRFCRNLYHSFADVGRRRWTKVIGSVIVYLILRPYIEKLFKWLQERDRRLQKEKEEKRKAALGGKKAKVSANSLRGGESGKVLGEVENTEDELEEDDEFTAEASGVPEWSKMARKRQKRYMKNLEKKEGGRAEKLSEDQIKELLDWSDDEDDKKNA